jgi:hypothetical protein
MRDMGFEMRDSRCGIRDAGFEMRDMGFEMRDAGYGIRDQVFFVGRWRQPVFYVELMITPTSIGVLREITPTFVGVLEVKITKAVRRVAGRR